MKNKHNSSKEAADHVYDPSDYEKQDEVSQGFATTHEQSSDTLTEGTIDGKIDQVDQDGKLVSHQGEELSRDPQTKRKR